MAGPAIHALKCPKPQYRPGSGTKCHTRRREKHLPVDATERLAEAGIGPPVGRVRTSEGDAVGPDDRLASHNWGRSPALAMRNLDAAGYATLGREGRLDSRHWPMLTEVIRPPGPQKVMVRWRDQGWLRRQDKSASGKTGVVQLATLSPSVAWRDGRLSGGRQGFGDACTLPVGQRALGGREPLQRHRHDRTSGAAPSSRRTSRTMPGPKAQVAGPSSTAYHATGAKPARWRSPGAVPACAPPARRGSHSPPTARFAASAGRPHPEAPARHRRKYRVSARLRLAYSRGEQAKVHDV